MNRPFNWLLASTLALILSASYLLDSPTDHHAEYAQAQALQDAIRAQQSAQRKERANAAMCGDNAGWIEQADGSIRCTLKNGKRTARVAMVTRMGVITTTVQP